MPGKSKPLRQSIVGVLDAENALLDLKCDKTLPTSIREHAETIMVDVIKSRTAVTELANRLEKLEGY